jgi:Tfp pilus assembly protein PilV
MTLPEVLVAMPVFIIAVGGFWTVHLFGLRLSDFVKAKSAVSASV